MEEEWTVAWCTCGFKSGPAAPKSETEARMNSADHLMRHKHKDG